MGNAPFVARFCGGDEGEILRKAQNDRWIGICTCVILKEVKKLSFVLRRDADNAFCGHG